MHTARSATIEIADGGRYFTKQPVELRVNGEPSLTTEKTITSLFSLKPDQKYVVEAYVNGEKQGEVSFKTDYEYVTLDVTRFGAKGDGEHDDTHFIQAAIMACPVNSRVYFPAGIYRITSLFLKSHIRIELAEGAELKAFTDREKFPTFPGMLQSYDETDEYNLGTWEGNPLPMFSGIICGIGAEDVVIYGQGKINGNASKENWWKDPKVMNIAFRPRLFFISGCKNVTLQGVTFCNSPSWTLHPYFSNDLKFIGVTVQNPSDSPNTDGLDPESCKNVEILGVRFSLGDDCIAVKSGKIYMGKKHKTPSENIHIRQCLMENGHGAVTLGSEMAGGVVNLTVEDCIFRHTDRGLRIKTRRGRGKDAILSNIIFRNLTLDHVMTPLVVNCFYFCDPDGKTTYVQSRDVYPVDDRTPQVKKMVFENMECTNCHVAAAFFDGLPEQKIEEIYMKDISISYAEDAKCDVPAMSDGVEKSSKRGMFARNVAKLTLDNVKIEGGVKLDGKDIFKEMDAITLRHRVGMVFQQPNPFPKSVYDNVAYGPRIFGIHRKAELDEIVERSLRQAAIWDELKDRLKKSALGLSGGQQQRLCIARALAVEPEVILMDEPTSALDPISTSKIEDLALELKKNYTIIMVTHNMQQAARISDNTVFFLLGEIVEAGKTEQIFRNPTQKKTEDYITGRFG